MAAGITGLFAPGYAPGDRSPGRVRLTLAERPGAAGTHRHRGVIRVSGRHRRDIPVKMADHVALDSVAPDAQAADRLQPLPLVRAHESPGARHQGFGQTTWVSSATVHRWIEGRGRGPRPDSYLKIVELLTGGRGGRRGSQGAYDVLAAETGKDRSTLRKWASAPQPMQEGNRLVALGTWHRLGYSIKSYLVVDFDRRLVELRQGRRNPRARWVKGFGYLSPNPFAFELWPWPARTSRQFGRRRFPAWRDSGRRLRGTVRSIAEGPVGRTSATSSRRDYDVSRAARGDQVNPIGQTGTWNHFLGCLPDWSQVTLRVRL